MCFVCIAEKNPIISLYSINWPVFTTDEMESVYCAVRTKSLNIIQINLSLEVLKLQGNFFKLWLMVHFYTGNQTHIRAYIYIALGLPSIHLSSEKK